MIGHELGHFLLDHHHANVGFTSANPEYFRQRRAQEISVDRLGLLSCGSLDVALRALMKTVSGLTERHLRFDVERSSHSFEKSKVRKWISQMQPIPQSSFKGKGSALVFIK